MAGRLIIVGLIAIVIASIMVFAPEILDISSQDEEAGWVLSIEGRLLPAETALIKIVAPDPLPYSVRFIVSGQGITPIYLPPSGTIGVEGGYLDFVGQTEYRWRISFIPMGEYQLEAFVEGLGIVDKISFNIAR